MQRGSEEYTRYILRANHTVHFMKEHCTRWKVESGITGSIINLIGDGRCGRCQAASPLHSRGAGALYQNNPSC